MNARNRWEPQQPERPDGTTPHTQREPRYNTENEAWAVVARLQADGTDAGSEHCELCHGWHVYP